MHSNMFVFPVLPRNMESSAEVMDTFNEILESVKTIKIMLFKKGLHYMGSLN